MIVENNLHFTLQTARSSYVFRVDETRHLEHLYYGQKISAKDQYYPIYDKHSIPLPSETAFDDEHPSYSLNNLCSETSSPGKGDYRETSVVIRDTNGSITHDFRYSDHRIIQGKPRSFTPLPESLAEQESVETLIIVTEDVHSSLTLELYYTTFYSSDVIVRKSALTNNGSGPVTLERIMSAQLDFYQRGLDLTTFDGAWGRERRKNRRPLTEGIQINDSKRGISSAAHNPLLLVSKRGTDEMGGECWAVNLIYSGDHSGIVELNPYGKTRLLSGINPATFRWLLESGEKFHTPEAILTFSASGHNGIRHNFHHFVNSHIVRGQWRYHQRPIAFNTWESTYFKFDETSLHRMAKEAAKAGIELFVVDDGWFGAREDDTTSLGDWMVNSRKFPSGLTHFSRRIHSLGLLFGLWFEPEMVCLKSTLYEEHPDWMVAIPGRNPSPARNQFLLDLSRKDVQDYLFDTLSSLWQVAEVDYIKWDMNRSFSDVYSAQLLGRQGEFSHRYILGLYTLLGRFQEAFPHILFESCASGGARFDLGMLAFMPQAWTSDNTDALSRIFIQEGTLCGYPLSAMSNHVSSVPNHQSLRTPSLDTRFNVASFGLLGYELDITGLSAHERSQLSEQIRFYKQYRTLLQYGQFFIMESAEDDSERVIWGIASADRSEIMVLFFQKHLETNAPHDILRIPFADPDSTYEMIPRHQKIDISMFGSLINAVSPVHVKEGSRIEKEITKNIHLDSEIEHYKIDGDLLAYRGISLNQQFSGTGFDRETRVLADHGSRLYYFRTIS